MIWSPSSHEMNLVVLADCKSWLPYLQSKPKLDKVSLMRSLSESNEPVSLVGSILRCYCWILGSIPSPGWVTGHCSAISIIIHLIVVLTFVSVRHLLAKKRCKTTYPFSFQYWVGDVWRNFPNWINNFSLISSNKANFLYFYNPTSIQQSVSINFYKY